jgi:hypothetical protein
MNLFTKRIYMKTSLIKTIDILTGLTDKVQILKRKTDTLLT